MRQRFDATNRAAKTYNPAGTPDFFSCLEPRQLLALTSPLPDIGALENANNPVARIVTPFGDIDIELFQDTNPLTVANFVTYINAGDYDQSFFHGLLEDFMLQGGGFRFEDVQGLTIVRDRGPIADEFNRSNVERTVAMTRLAGPNSATNQFFFNLADNSATLDQQPDGGSTVFARVLTDVSWSVVQTIANLPVVDMTDDPRFDHPHGGDFTHVPGGPYASESNLVLVLDIELIKPAGIPDFYDEAVQYPEGFAGSTINEFLPMGNPNDQTAYYQVIARSEVSTGFPGVGYSWFRDKVIATGSIAPNSRGGITISRFLTGGGASPDTLVERGVPYALEVRSTLPISANLSHYDFGTSTGENLTTATSNTWTFGEGSKLQNSINQFIVWYNPGPQDVDLDVTFFFDDGSTFTTEGTITTGRYRRGGINIADFNPILNNTNFSIRITADGPITAALTGYDRREDGSGFTALGLPGEGSTRGVVPMGNAGASARQLISFFNPSTTDTAHITLTFSFSDGSDDFVISPAALQLAAGRRATFNVGDIPELNTGSRFTIRYFSGSVPVYAHTRNVQFTDEVGYPVGVDAATRWDYAEGFADPARAGTDVFEMLSIFNPNFGAMGRADVSANVSIRYVFSQGGPGVVEQHTIAPGGRLDINPLGATLNYILDNHDYFYSIEVTSDAPIMSQFWHHDLTLGGLQPSGGFGELGAPAGDIVRLG